MLAGGGGAHIIYSASVGRQSGPPPYSGSRPVSLVSPGLVSGIGRVLRLWLDRLVAGAYAATVEVEGPLGVELVDARSSEGLATRSTSLR
jgi:hypothetical protein